MKFKGVIFDFNGTLFFDNDKHIKAWEEISKLIREHGISEDELHTKFNGVPNNQIISYVFDGKCTQDELEQYSKLKEKYYRQFCAEDKANFHLVSDVENYYNELKVKGYLLLLQVLLLKKILISLSNHSVLINGLNQVQSCMITEHMKIR